MDYWILWLKGVTAWQELKISLQSPGPPPIKQDSIDSSIVPSVLVQFLSQKLAQTALVFCLKAVWEEKEASGPNFGQWRVAYFA